MRKTIIIIVGLLFSINLLAQKSFEGEIIYELSENTKAPAKINLRLLLGNGKLKLDFPSEEKNSSYPSTLIRFDSSMIFTFDIENKTYSKRKLVNKYDDTTYKKETILGYTTKTINPDFNTSHLFLGTGASNDQMRVSVADNLNFFVPDSIESNPELALFQNNKIVLKLLLEFKDQFNKSKKEQINTIIALQAVSIKEMKINEEVFNIPLDFRFFENKPFPSTENLQIFEDSQKMEEIKKAIPPLLPLNSPSSKKALKSKNIKTHK